MALGVASGHPQLASVGSPEIWSPKLLVKFYAASTLAAITNGDYEGEIKKMGCKVHIRTTPDVTVRAYTKGQDLTMEALTPGKVELEIDKGNYWYVNIDDVDRFQGDIDYMEDWTNDASMQQKIYVDSQVFAAVYADADASNKGANAGKISAGFNLGASGAPFQLTAANALDAIVDLGTVFDEQNVPEEDRKLVLPAWAVGRIKKSDIKNASITGDGKSTLRSGRIGMIDRFEVFSSNLLTAVDDSGGSKAWHAIAAQRRGVCFASQFIENQVFDKLEAKFGRAARGLQVYGWKTLKAEAVIDFYICR